MGTLYLAPKLLHFMSMHATPQNSFDIKALCNATGISDSGVRKIIKEYSDSIAAIDSYPKTYYYVPSKRCEAIIQRYLMGNATARMETNAALSPTPTPTLSIPNPITLNDTAIEPPVAETKGVAEKYATSEMISYITKFGTKKMWGIIQDQSQLDMKLLEALSAFIIVLENELNA